MGRGHPERHANRDEHAVIVAPVERGGDGQPGGNRFLPRRPPGVAPPQPGGEAVDDPFRIRVRARHGNDEQRGTQCRDERGPGHLLEDAEHEIHRHRSRDADDDRLGQQPMPEHQLRHRADRLLQRRADIPEVAQRQIAGEQLPGVGQVLIVVVDRRARQDRLVQSGDERDENAEPVIARARFDTHQAGLAKHGIDVAGSVPSATRSVRVSTV